MNISDLASKVFGDKRRWRAYKARVHALPAGHREAAEAIERYLMYFGAADGANAASMYEDLVDLFEQAVADGTPIRGIVGDDPLEFVEAFVANYRKGGYINRERERLVKSIDEAEAKEGEKP